MPTAKKKIYFDNNVYDKLLTEVSVSALKVYLASKDYELVLSVQNIYEVASCFKSGNQDNAEKGIEVANFLRKLHPYFLLTSRKRQIAGEVERLGKEGQRPSSPFLTGRDKTAGEEEIKKLASGTYDNTISNFVNKEWRQKEEEVKVMNEYVFHNRDKKREFKTIDFEVVLARNPHSIEEQAHILIGKNVSVSVPTRRARKTLLNNIVNRFMKHKRECPVITTCIRANIYMCYRGIKNYNRKNMNAISHDVWDDVRHIIESTHCDLFVTKDKDIKKYFNDIRPSGSIEFYKDFFSRL